jgi:AraC-like DNA-binding protein
VDQAVNLGFANRAKELAICAMQRTETPTIRANVLANVVAELNRLGIEAEPLLFKHVKGIEGLADPYREVPLEDYVAFFEAAAEASADPALGARLGSRFRPDQLGPLGVVFVAAPSLRFALERLGRFLEAWQGGTSVALESGAGVAEWSYRIDDPAISPRRQDAEFTLSATCGFIRTLLGQAWRPIEVHLEHPLHPDAGPRERRALETAFKAPVLHEQGANRVVLDPADLDRPASSVGQAIAPYLEQHLRDLMEARAGTESCSAMIRRLIARRIGRQRLDLASLAEEAGLSGRTLQRRLAAEATNLRALVLQHRLQLAEPVLKDGSSPITSIAHGLGYADPTVFARAFRSWRGQSPRAFRAAANRRSPIAQAGGLRSSR